MRRISKGKRAHLLALCTPPGTITIALRDRATLQAKKAVWQLKKLERAIRHMKPVPTTSLYAVEARVLPYKATPRDIKAWDAYARAKYGVTS